MSQSEHSERPHLDSPLGLSVTSSEPTCLAPPKPCKACRAGRHHDCAGSSQMLNDVDYECPCDCGKPAKPAPDPPVGRSGVSNPDPENGWRCPNGCEDARPAWWPAPQGGTTPPCANCDAPLVALRASDSEAVELLVLDNDSVICVPCYQDIELPEWPGHLRFGRTQQGECYRCGRRLS